MGRRARGSRPPPLSSQLPSLPALTSLTRLEASYIQIRSLAPLTALSGGLLADVGCASNKVATVEALGGLSALTSLELGSNRVASLDGLAALPTPTLVDLWLGRNRVTGLAGLGAPGLAALVRVSLQSNRLASMADLPPLPALRELYLSHNGIEEVAGLERVPGLRVLDLGANRVARVAGLAAAGPLTDLWLNDNPVDSLEDVLNALKGSAAVGTLTCVYLAATPAATSAGKGPPGALATPYVDALTAALPALTCVDGDDLPPRGRRVGTGKEG